MSDAGRLLADTLASSAAQDETVLDIFAYSPTAVCRIGYESH